MELCLWIKWFWKYIIWQHPSLSVSLFFLLNLKMTLTRWIFGPTLRRGLRKFTRVVESGWTCISTLLCIVHPVIFNPEHDFSGKGCVFLSCASSRGNYIHIYHAPRENTCGHRVYRSRWLSILAYKNFKHLFLPKKAHTPVFFHWFYNTICLKLFFLKIFGTVGNFLLYWLYSGTTKFFLKLDNYFYWWYCTNF